MVLPALAAHQLPLPLGGTSNHFRMDALIDAGAWDPHNVTEDADLGFRLARLGYKTGILQSITFEEANTKIGNWVHQRSRWFKGFLQTWLVHMRNPIEVVHEIGIAGFVTLQATVLGVVLSAALYPIFLGSSLYQLATVFFVTPTAPDPWATLAQALYMGLFICGLGVMLHSGAEALHRKRLSGWHLTIATMPLYWLLASVAAWLAIWQLLFNPFHWNKTVHGLSRLMQRPNSVSPTYKASRTRVPAPPQM